MSTFAGRTLSSQLDGLGTSATFINPRMITFEASTGFLWVCDGSNARVRKISPAGLVSTVGTIGSTPYGIASDPLSGAMFISDTAHRIWRLAAGASTATLFAGTGVAGSSDNFVATSATFNAPQGIAVDGSGNVYVSGTGGHRVRVITPAGFVFTVAGSTAGTTNAWGTAALFNGPTGIATDSVGSVYVVDSASAAVRKLVFPTACPVVLPVCDGRWRHVAVSVANDASAESITAFVDGILVGRSSRTYALQSPSSFNVGWNGASVFGGNFLTGSIADVRVYARALTTVEITAIAQYLPPLPVFANSHISAMVVGGITSYVGTCAAGFYGPVAVLLAQSATDRSWTFTGANIACTACASSSYSFGIVTPCPSGTCLPATATFALPPTSIPAGQVTACAPCPPDAVFVSATASCTPTAGPGVGPTDTSVCFSGSAAETNAAYIATGGLSSVGDRYSGTGGALALTSGSYLTAPAGALPLPVGSNDPFSTSIWLNCPTTLTTPGSVMEWGATTQTSTTNVGRASLQVRAGAFPTSAGVATNIVCGALVERVLPAVSWTFNEAGPIALEYSTGALIVGSNNQVFKVINGVRTSIAGQLNGGFGRVDGQGSVASFYQIYGLDIDQTTGFIVLADFSNNLLRLVSPTGLVSKLAGGGAAGNQGGNVNVVDAAVPATACLFLNLVGVAIAPGGTVLYVSDNAGFRRLTFTGGWTGNVTSVLLIANIGSGISFDLSGNLLGFQANNLVRVTTSGTVTSTVIASGFSSAQDVAVDTSGNMYVADKNSLTVRLVTPAGVVSTYVGGGSAGTADSSGFQAQFVGATGIVRSATGVMYVTDGAQIRAITPAAFCPITLAVCDAKWHHVAVTFDGAGSTAVRAYVDGTLVGTSSRDYSFAVKSDFRLGWNGATAVLSGSPYVGTIMDARVYLRALTVAELTAMQVVAVPSFPGANNPVFVVGRLSYSWSCPLGFVGLPMAATRNTDNSWRWPSVSCVACSSNQYTYGQMGCSSCPTTTTWVSNSAPCVPDAGLGATDAVFYFSGTSAEGFGGFNAGTGLTFLPDQANRADSSLSFVAGSYLATPLGFPTGLPSGTSGASASAWVKCLTAQSAPGTVIEWGITASYGGTGITSIIGTTLAGSATAGSANGVGTSATFSSPQGLASNRAGLLYVTSGHQIRIISLATRTVTTLAGSAIGSFSAGVGTSAQFNAPFGLVVDAAQTTLYVADSGNKRIRAVNISSGDVTTLAGTGAGCSGAACAVNGAAGMSTFNYPTGVALSPSGALLYVADREAFVVRVIDLTALTVSTLAGLAGSALSRDGPASFARFTGPQALAVAPSGDIYVAEVYPPFVIRAVTPAGTVTTFAGCGTCVTGAVFNSPSGLAFDSVGNLFVNDRGNSFIRMLRPSGEMLSPVGGTGYVTWDGGASSLLQFAQGIALDTAGAIMIADSGSNRVRKLAISTLSGPADLGRFTLQVSAGTMPTVAAPANVTCTTPVVDTFVGGQGTGNAGGQGAADGIGTSATLRFPVYIAMDSASNMYITDQGASSYNTGATIRRVTPSRNMTTFVSIAGELRNRLHPRPSPQRPAHSTPCHPSLAPFPQAWPPSLLTRLQAICTRPLAPPSEGSRPLASLPKYHLPPPVPRACA